MPTGALKPLARLAVLLASLALGACAATDAAGLAPTGDIPAGKGQQVADLGGTSLQVFTYRPDGCTPSAILLVFHGVGRNAAGYRDYAIPLAQRFCMLVVTPLFDEARFPGWRYQRGGVVHDEVVQPPEDWTVNLVPRLAAWAQQRSGRPGLPYALLGHSAGAQFLSRVAAYGQGGAAVIVIANPSTWVRPRLDVTAPYGFGGIYTPPEDKAALRRYLALPITVLLGGVDTGSRWLAVSKQAEAQGRTRLERGETVFREAEQAARRYGFLFNWRLAVVPGVGHNAREMFASRAAIDAFRPLAGYPGHVRQ